MSDETPTLTSLADEAHRRAQHYTPSPKTDPVKGGAIGAVIAGVVIGVFTIHAGLGSDAVPTAEGFTIVIGFLVPFAYLNYQERLHNAAWYKEFVSLKQDRDAARSGQENESTDSVTTKTGPRILNLIGIISRQHSNDHIIQCNSIIRFSISLGFG